VASPRGFATPIRKDLTSLNRIVFDALVRFSPSFLAILDGFDVELALFCS